MLRFSLAYFLVLALLGSSDVGLADEEPSCLSGSNPRFNKAGAPSPSGAPSDVGIVHQIELATEEYQERASAALMRTLKTVPRATNPAMKDQYGLPVNPFSKIPSYIIGTRETLSLLAGPGARRALIDATTTDFVRRRIFGIIVSKYSMADALVAQYRMLAATTTVSPEVRQQYVDQIGRLINGSEYNFEEYFGIEIVKVGYVDGTVRARNELDVVDADLKDERLNKEAVDTYAALQGSDSYYKDLSLQEILCRVEAMNIDAEAAAKVAVARAEAVEDRQRREDFLQRTRMYDEMVKANPSPRPGSTDVIPSSPGTSVWSGSGSLGNGSGNGGNGDSSDVDGSFELDLSRLVPQYSE